MKHLLAAALLLATLLGQMMAYGSEVEVKTAIQQISPSVSTDTLDTYAKLIYDNSVKYNVDWRIAVAIFRQESNFNLEAVNYKSRDFGIGQMNYKTMQTRKIDLVTLLTDPNYAIEHTFKLLSELKHKYGKLDKKHGRLWYTRYHSYTADKRADYAALLKRHIAKIDEAVRHVQIAKNTSRKLSRVERERPGEMEGTR